MIATKFSTDATSPRPLRLSLTWLSFLVLVIVPTIVYTIYLALIAAPTYEAGFRIQIKSPGQSSNFSLGQIFGLTGAASSASDNGYAVTQYLQSADAVTDIDHGIGLRRRFTGSAIDDLARLGVDAPIERVVAYWRRHLKADFEQTTSTVSVTVSAYSPGDALALANAALLSSERLLNRMTERARGDSVRLAQAEVDRSEGKVRAIEQKMLVTRSRERVIDAPRQVTSAMARISELQSIADKWAADVEVRRRYLSPGAPGLALAEERLAVARRNVEGARAMLASNAVPSNDTLAGTVGKFDAIESEKAFAEKRLQNALASLLAAESDAQRQQLYLDTVVSPRLPQEESYPRFFRDVGLFVFFAASAWIVLLLVGAAVRDHARP